MTDHPSTPQNLLRPLRRILAIFLLVATSAAGHALPTITRVVETGGDDSVNTPAQFTGETFSHPNLGNYSVGTFQEEAPAFRDRVHQWNGATADLPLPAYLVGGEYIMIRNDNRDNANLKLEVTVAEEVLVYLLVDNRLADATAADPPEYGNPLESWTFMSWLATEGWAPVLNGLNRNADPNIPDEVGVDEAADGVGAGQGINQYSSVYFKQFVAGTFTLLQMGEAGRNMYGVVVKRLPSSINNPPEILNVIPANNSLFYSAAGGLGFTAKTTAPNRIDPSGIKLFLNDVDVSAGLTISGTGTDRTVKYADLRPDTRYVARIVVADQAARTSTVSVSFDTFSSTTSIAIEVEDYNYDGGQFVAAPTPAGYEGFTGTPEIDYHDNNTVTPATVYRLNDFVSLGVSGDAPRPAFTAAGATDYQVTGFLQGDWMNYTRTIPAGTYQAFLRGGSGSVGAVRLDRVTSGAGQADQALSPLGAFTTGNTAYAYIPLADAAGNAVTLSLSGNTTFRLTALASPAPSLQLNFLLLVPIVAPSREPFVSSTSPAANALDVPVTSTVQASIVAGSTPLTPANVTLTFNGTDVTTSASIVTTPDGLAVTYDPPGDLALNTPYPVVVTVTPSGGTSTAYAWSFSTRPFAPLITQVVETDGDDSLATPAQFTGQTFSHPNLGTFTVPTFREDVPAFRDRVHQWNGLAAPFPIPAYLLGGDYVMIRNDNRDNFPFQLDVTVSEPALIYVLVDTRLSDGNADNPPDFSGGMMSWLLENGWEPVRTAWNRIRSLNVPDEVAYDEGGDGVGPGAGLNTYASIYWKTVPAGTVTLLQADNSGRNMYGVVARAVATNPFRPVVAITTPANGATYGTAPATIPLTAAAAVQNSTITKVEFFLGADQKLGEATGSPYTLTWSNVEAGRHRLTARATAANGQSAASDPIEVVVGSVVSVNFQDAIAAVPTGYLADYGDIFGDRGNGHVYGWDDDNVANARDRNDLRSIDERYDTFNHMQKPLPSGQVWEIELPNGRYGVHAVVGEAANFDSVYDLLAEGVPVVAGTPNTNVRWFEGTVAVVVSDGRLTLSNGPSAVNNKIGFVDIAQLPAEVPKPVFNQPKLEGANLTITWTGGGRLQHAPDVNGPYTDVSGNPQGTYTTPASEGRRFYRAIVP